MSRVVEPIDDLRSEYPTDSEDVPRPAGRRRVTLAAALRSYPMVLLIPVIALVAAGVTLGIRRHPTYSASTQLNVGVPDANSQATPGYAQAAEQLASSYSQQATSSQVFSTVARRLKLSEAEVKSRVSTDTVPSSSTFYINATGSTTSEAVRLSTTTARVLQTVVDASKRKSDPAQMLATYRRLQDRANTLNNKVGQLKSEQAAGLIPTSQTQVQKAQLAYQVAQLQAQAQAGRYSSAVTQSASPNLAILNPARSASSDRRTYVERYGLIGLAAGLVIGADLAYIVAILSARLRRRTA